MSSMLPNNTRFAFNWIEMLAHLLTHLKPSSIEILLLVINNLNHLGIFLGVSIIDYISRV